MTGLALVALVAAAVTLAIGAGSWVWGVAVGALAVATSGVVALVVASARQQAKALERLVDSQQGLAAGVVEAVRVASAPRPPVTPAPRPAAPPAPKPKPKPAPVPASAAWKNHPLAARLMESGYFDADYYRAVAVARFARDADAASHYLSVGVPKLQSPSPFVDVTALPPSVRSAMQQGQPAALLDFLVSDALFRQPLSDWFDARELDVSRAALRGHPGGPLGWFVSHLDDETPLPVGAESPHHGVGARRARTVLLKQARAFGEGRQLTGPRESSTWDVAAEAAWLAELAQTSLDPDTAPLVSVIMPVRTRAGVIGRAIDSVAAQTYGRWQLVVVDDGSEDDTVAVVQARSAEDERIVLVHNPGEGVSAARNAGLAAAEGEYVAFLDSDNEWFPTFLDTMVRAMRRDGLRAAYAGSELSRGGSKETYRAFRGGLDHLLVLNHIDLNIMVVETAVATEVGGFDVTMRRWVDHDFAIRVARVAEPVLLPFLGCRYDHSDTSTDRITVRESEHWQWVALGRNLVSWEAAEQTERVAGRVSVVIPTYGDSSMTIAACRSVLADGSHTDVEVLVVDNGSDVTVGQTILRAFVGDERVRYTRMTRNYNFAIGCNIGVAAATGEYLLFLNNDTVLRGASIAPLVARLADSSVRGVQPLLQYADDTIQTAGTVFPSPDALPTHFLVGHPPTDADHVGSLHFSAVTAAALLMRTDEVVALRGFDPIFVNGMEDVDLCLRAVERFGGWFVVEPASRITHLESKTPGRSKNIGENRRLFMDRWRGRLPRPTPEHYRAVGFEIAHVGSDYSPVPAARPLVVRERGSRGRRWSLKISSIPGPVGDLWGDTHFADSLRASLQRRGQDVAIYRHSSHEVPATVFDDVVLSLRGLTRVKPVPGKVNVLWIISHPEMVTPEELAEFDLVFASSIHWSERTTAETGVHVRPLLQATDVERFNTDVAPAPQGASVFVGGCPPNRERQIVVDAVSAGVPLRVYGPGWTGRVPAGLIGGEYVENHELCAVYRGSDRVLADHWPDMARAGFLQNRLFDAVAAGCRVVSDPVLDVEQVFEGAVQVYRSPEELAFLCSPEGAGRFPDDDTLREIAARVAHDHSFDWRAVQLVEAVEEFLDGASA